MYKGKRKVLMKVLSLALAAGMSVSGLPVSALAAETADADVQEEAVVEPETAIDITVYFVFTVFIILSYFFHLIITTYFPFHKLLFC